jgi:hypothetical protein
MGHQEAASRYPQEAPPTRLALPWLCSAYAGHPPSVILGRYAVRLSVTRLPV